MSEPPSPTRESSRLLVAAKWGVLILLPPLVYSAAMSGGFIWDDDDHVYANPTLVSTDGLREIWFDKNALPQYYPVVHTTFWLEFQLWQRNAIGYHVTNVVLHTLCAICLWRLLTLLNVPGAWLAALLFAVHPVHVESVAWVSERKNVLSGLFYLLAASVYVRHFVVAAEQGKIARPEARRWLWYAVFFVLFVAALLSKSVTATLPAALLLIVWFKQGSISRLHFGLLAPVLVVGVLMGLRTAQIERDHVGAVGVQFDWSIAERCLIAGRAVWFYAVKLAWPQPLAFFYPKWELDSASAWQWLYPIGAVALVVVLWALRKRLGRGPLTAVLYFGGTLLPALGFVNYYPLRFSFVADHFQYLASIGLLVLFAAAAATWMKRLTMRAAESGKSPIAAFCWQAVCGVVIGFLCVVAARHAHVLADAERLYRDTLTKNPRAVVAHNQLGLILQRRGDLEAALDHFQKVVEIESDRSAESDALNRANVLATQGEVSLKAGNAAEAIEKLTAAVDLWPKEGRNYLFLAEAYRVAGDVDAALRNSTQALERGYRIPSAFLLNANLASQVGDYETAISAYRGLLSLAPDPQSAAELAWILAAHWDPEVRREQEAISLAQYALQYNANAVRAFDALAAAEAHSGRTQSAVQYAEQAMQQALADGNEELAEEIRQRLEAYRGGGTYVFGER